MKLLLLLVPVFLFASMPDWFFKLKPTHNNEVIGYGVAQTLAEAKKEALSDLTQKINVSVKSSTSISLADDNGNVSKSSASNIDTSSQAKISGVKYIKVENLDGDWYVASAYDNSAIEVKLKRLLDKSDRYTLKNEEQNSYLKNTSLIKRINDYLKYDLEYNLVYKDDLWQLNYRDIYLPLNQNDLYNLFTNTSSKKISITANKKIYLVGDEMYFSIKKPENTYLSILYVEHNGKVGSLISNQKYPSTLTFPDLKSEDAFSIINPYDKTISELYIAISSNEKIDLSKFENVSDKLLDNSNYNFHKLIKKLENYDFSTYQIKIRAQKEHND